MTCKELIVYILENNLENEPVFQNGEFIGFFSVDKVAEMYDVGRETVKTWISLGLIKNTITIGNNVFVPITELLEKHRIDGRGEKQ